MKQPDALQKKKIICWLTSLATKIDPISGISISDDSVLNNKKIQEVLKEAARIVELSIGKRDELAGAARLVSSDIIPEDVESMTISELCERINEIVYPEIDRSIRPAMITLWLENRGYLRTESNSEGYCFKVATSKGEQLGIVSKECKSKTTSVRYATNYYNNSACRFIIENLETILLS